MKNGESRAITTEYRRSPPGVCGSPFWVLPNGVILLERFSPLYEQARDFLIQIAEPVTRPDFLHEYKLHKDALFAAVSMGLTPDTIIDFLERLSKVGASAFEALVERPWR